MTTQEFLKNPNAVRLIRILSELGENARIEPLTSDYAILDNWNRVDVIWLSNVPSETPEDIDELHDDILADEGDAFHEMIEAGAKVMLWCDCGISTGIEVIEAGPYLLTADENNGYQVCRRDKFPDIELIPADEYDEDKAIAAASDLDGYFGVVGVPGSIHHDFKWFRWRSDAQFWVKDQYDLTLSANPAMGDISTAVLTAEDAFAITYRDGSRVYFQPKDGGMPGYEPKGK